jgi:hypothetical protein
MFRKWDALAQFCQRFYHDRLKDLFHSHVICIIETVMARRRHIMHNAQTLCIRTSYKLRSDQVGNNEDVLSAVGLVG